MILRPELCLKIENARIFSEIVAHVFFENLSFWMMQGGCGKLRLRTKDLEAIVRANERQKRLDAEKDARLETVSEFAFFSHAGSKISAKYHLN